MGGRNGTAGAMKIVYPYPAYWPYMRRGVERCIHDLSNFLASRGHDVTIITSKPGRPRVAYDGPVRVVYLKQQAHPLVMKYYPLSRLYAFGIEATMAVHRGRYDVAHLWSYSALLGAAFFRQWMDIPYLFHVVLRRHNWRGRFDKHAFAQLMRNAEQVVALTPGGAAETQETYGVPVGTLPPPVDMSVFRPHEGKDLSRPRILFTGDLGDPRKGGALLLRAWDEIHRRCPEAMLVLAGPFGVIGHDLGFEVYTLERLSLVHSPAARDAIEILGAGSLASLPYEYSRAAVTVLPSYEEAFGMVVTESLACGTPVVCSSYAGPGEIVTSPDVGVTVPIASYLDVISEGKAHELAEAVLECIDLARRPETSARCREWAEPWGLDRIGLLTEAALAEVAGTRGPAVQLEREEAVAWRR